MTSFIRIAVPLNERHALSLCSQTRRVVFDQNDAPAVFDPALKVRLKNAVHVARHGFSPSRCNAISTCATVQPRLAAAFSISFLVMAEPSSRSASTAPAS